MAGDDRSFVKVFLSLTVANCCGLCRNKSNYINIIKIRNDYTHFNVKNKPNIFLELTLILIH